MECNANKGKGLIECFDVSFFNLQIKVRFNLPLKDMFILNSRNYR